MFALFFIIGSILFFLRIGVRIKYMKNTMEDIAIIILAAGLGKRMKSDKAKVLHEVLGVPMILHILKTANSVAGENIVIVVGHQADKVKKIVSEKYKVTFAFQEEQKGTGHAVLCALPHLPKTAKSVIILCGDVPMLTIETLGKLINCHKEKNHDLSLLSVEVDDPKGYGRLILDDDSNLCGIVEEADAQGDQKKIKTVNAGIYCVTVDLLRDILPKIKSNNEQGELYFTDIVGMTYHKGEKSIGAITCSDYKEVMGVNSQDDLQIVEKNFSKRMA